MYNRQFHHPNNTLTRESFKKPSMTEPDNAMSIPEIISRYMRGHGIPVQVLPDSMDQAALEDGRNFEDDLDMFSEERQAALAAAAQGDPEPSSQVSGEPSPSSEAPET